MNLHPSEENHMQFLDSFLSMPRQFSKNGVQMLQEPLSYRSRPVKVKTLKPCRIRQNARNEKGLTGGQTADESLEAIADQMKESTSGEINTEPASALSVEVSLPVSWTEDGQAVCHVTFEFNDEEITIHHPVETWHSGWHILTLYYPIEHIVAELHQYV